MDFEFEKPIIELEERLKELKKLSENKQIDLSREIASISEKISALKSEIYEDLEPWQVARVARHIQRPSTLDIIKHICDDDFVELHGDRLYGDDPAIVCGPAKIGNHRVMIIGHQKGHDTDQNILRNFGMPHPEGYRKALRMMHMAERFDLPVIVFIDTPGAFPGIGAEERGQSEAIAKNLAEMSQLKVPIICFVTGEGGSGGALAIGVGDLVFMFQYSVYSVISAEGCAAILWKDAAKSKEAATALKIRSKNLLDSGIIDGILPEPSGGAHRNHRAAAEEIKKTIEAHLPQLQKIPSAQLINNRYAKYRSMGRFSLQDEEL